MESLIQDLRYAVRGLLRTPGFAALAILCLALGIGVNSTVFSVADTTLLRPLPFDDPGRLVALYSTQPANSVNQSAVSYQDYRDWKEQLRSYTDIAAHSYRGLTITEGIESERFLGSTVTSNLFPLLGVDPILGRHFTDEDDRAGATPVVMLSHGVWLRRYLGDPSILGRVITVNGTAHTVIGVMPPTFQFPQLAQLWIPLVPLEHAVPRGQRALVPYARLAANTTFEGANRELVETAARLAAIHREDQGWSARVVSMRDDLMPEDIRLASIAMMGAVSMVLIVACANVANLLLARATARQREMAVRTALGAGQRRVLRQLLTESMLLGLLAAPLGVLVGYAGLKGIDAASPPGAMVPYYVDWSMNTRVVVYTTAISILTGVIFGLAPALQAARANLFSALKDGGRGSGGSRTRNRVRNGLVVVEVALSLVLLVGASLFVRSYLNISSASTGIDTDRLLTMRVFMAEQRYGEADARGARVEDIVRRVESLPGVAAAFASNLVPTSGGGSNGAIVLEGTDHEPGREPRIYHFGATAHAIRTLGQTMLSGRDFTDAEGSTRSGQAIVNHAFTRRFWPGRSDVVGRRFRFLTDPPDEWLTVLGVVGDFQPLLLRNASSAEPFAILPYPYRPAFDNGITIRVASGAPGSITGAARQAVGEADPSLAVYDARTGQANRELRSWGAQIISKMFGVFGAAALFLAAIGIYGVLSYSVAQRTQEFGVRIALGATRNRVLTLVLGQGVRLALVGITIGAIGAMGVTRIVRSILYNVTPTDPLSFGGTALLLAAVTILAGCVPATRATAVDPIVALRAD